MVFDPRYIGHIFRSDEGHVPDTPENRNLLRDTIDPAFRLGRDRYGNTWYARILPDRRQVWASVRNGLIRNGGINETPHVFDPVSGLSRRRSDG